MAVIGVRRSVSERAFRVVLYLILGLLSLITLYPFWYVIEVSLTDPLWEYNESLFWPKGFYYANYYRIFSQSGIGMAYFISVLRILTAVPAMIVVTGAAGFALTRKELKGRKTIILYYFLTMFVSGGLIPFYMVLKTIGLIDTFFVYVFPTIFSVWTMIVMKTSFQSLPEGLVEAGLIDGASYLRIFARIILPLSLPMIATLSLFSAVGHWNDWFTGIFYVQKPRLQPLATFLRIQILQTQAWHLQGAYAGVNEEILEQLERLTSRSLVYALLVVGTVPILVVYPFLQRFFIKGVLIGSIKG